MKVGAGTTNLFGRWIASEGIAKDIAVRQLATKTDSEQSWFDEVKYCIWLSAGIVWLALTIPVIGGGSFQIKVEKNGQQGYILSCGSLEEQWRKEIKSSTTLKYINPDSIKVGRARHVWSSV